MKVNGEDLIFISWIKRDGSGTIPMEESNIKPDFSLKLRILSLSLSENTYIASDGFNCFVVRAKITYRQLKEEK